MAKVHVLPMLPPFTVAPVVTQCLCEATKALNVYVRQLRRCADLQKAGKN